MSLSSLAIVEQEKTEKRAPTRRNIEIYKKGACGGGSEIEVVEVEGQAHFYEQ